MKISVMDCTLRDGGYVNGFHFGVSRIRKIKEKLCEASIEIIECGFLQSGKNDPEYSLYGKVEQIQLPTANDGPMFVAMAAFGEIGADEISPHRPGLIDGIRLTFHNAEWEETKRFAKSLMDKGYKVFIQPVGTLSYTDKELLALIKEVNELAPYAFYLVDTLGMMYKNDLLRMFFLIEHNLSENICMGLHSHNNLQLSFANAMTLLELHTDRHIIIDSSVFGIGRGAGNLNTELITHYINCNIEKRYNLVALLELMDDIILPIRKYDSWGFSASYYLSAIVGVHPNYATYLIDKQSMGMSKIFEILDKIPDADKHLFVKSDIQRLYYAEMSNHVEDSAAVSELSAKVNGREVLVVAPGSSVRTNAGVISKYIEATNPFVIALNFIPEKITSELVFVCNRKRYEQLQSSEFPIAVTSNIGANGDKIVYVIDYDSLLTDKPGSDFSGIMVLRFLIRLGVKHVALAGYDGFTEGTNHYDKSFDSYLTSETIASLNNSMSMQLREISKVLSYDVLTPSIYGREGNPTSRHT